MADQETTARPPLKLGVGGPGFVHLNHFGALINEAYGQVPYLVGSATVGKTWRDVDVRLILPDEEFNRRFGTQRPYGLDAEFALLCAGISALGERMTGLPIDFQFQPMTEANEKYKGYRQPLGIWNYPARISAPAQPDRPPRVWTETDCNDEPDDCRHVVDRDGLLWWLDEELNAWAAVARGSKSWWSLARKRGPLTEVLP